MTKKKLSIAFLAAIAVAIAFSLHEAVKTAPTAVVSGTAKTTIIATTSTATTAPRTRATAPAAAEPIVQTPTENPATTTPNGPALTITVGSSTYTVATRDGETVIDAMNDAKVQGLAFSGENYPSLGFFVESINGITAQKGYNWMLYLNGTQANVGASSAHVSAGDAVEWRYEK